MKRYFVILVTLILLYQPAEAGLFKAIGSVVGSIGSVVGIGGGSKTAVEIGTKKNTEIKDIKAGVNDVSLDLKYMVKMQVQLQEVQQVQDIT